MNIRSMNNTINFDFQVAQLHVAGERPKTQALLWTRWQAFRIKVGPILYSCPLLCGWMSSSSSSAQTIPTCAIVVRGSRSSAFEADGLRVSFRDDVVHEARLERQRRVVGRAIAVRHRRVKSMAARSRKLWEPNCVGSDPIPRDDFVRH